MHKENQKSKIIKDLKHIDASVRLDALYDIEGYINDNLVLSIVLNLLNDSDYLIRAQVLEIVELNQIPIDVKILIKCINDKNLTVKGAALLAAGKLNTVELTPIIENLYRTSGDYIKVRCCFTLYNFGLKKYLYEAMKFIDSKNYKIRCAVVNLAKCYVERDDLIFVNKVFKNKLLNEKAISVKSSLNAFFI